VAVDRSGPGRFALIRSFGIGVVQGKARRLPKLPDCYPHGLDLFEKICSRGRLAGVNERTVSAFVAGLRKEPGRRPGETGMVASSIKVRLQFLYTALSWAAGQNMLAVMPKFPPFKVPRKDPQPVAPEAFERLLARAPDAQMRAYMLCGWPRRSTWSASRPTRRRGWT